MKVVEKPINYGQWDCPELRAGYKHAWSIIDLGVNRQIVSMHASLNVRDRVKFARLLVDQHNSAPVDFEKPVSRIWSSTGNQTIKRGDAKIFTVYGGHRFREAISTQMWYIIDLLNRYEDSLLLDRVTKGEPVIVRTKPIPAGDEEKAIQYTGSADVHNMIAGENLFGKDVHLLGNFVLTIGDWVIGEGEKSYALTESEFNERYEFVKSN
jgi:hypothetical protein